MRTQVNRVIDRLQQAFPPNRVVVILTPLVFAPAAGWIAAFVAKNVPGVTLSDTQVLAAFSVGALIAFGKAYKWLDGWQQHETLLGAPNPPAGVQHEAISSAKLKANHVTAAKLEPVASDPSAQEAARRALGFPPEAA